MNETLTLFREDPRFKDYLTGKFSRSERAIPIQSLNVGTSQESVTFEIKDIKEVGAPSAFYVWMETIRLDNLLLSILVLSIVIWQFEASHFFWNRTLAILSLIGCLFVHIASHLLNDYMDHMKGLDRQNPLTGSRTIQRGWLTALQVKRVGYACFALGLLFGLPAAFEYPIVFFVILLGILVALSVFSSHKLGVRLKGSAEMMTFILFGPLMVNGFALACAGKVDENILFFSFLVGWSFTLFIHIKNLEQVIYNSKNIYKNWVGRLGFVKGRNLIYIWLAVLVILSFGEWVLFESSLLLMCPSFFVIFLSIGLFRKLSQSKLTHSQEKGSLRLWGKGYLYGFYIIYNLFYFLSRSF